MRTDKPFLESLQRFLKKFNLIAKRGSHYGVCQKMFRCQIQHFYGEFDSGSERTLAAWIRHASRTKNFNSLLMRFLVADGLVTRENPTLEWGIAFRKED